MPKDSARVQNWFNRDAVVVPTDPSQPFGNAAAQQRTAGRCCGRSTSPRRKRFAAAVADGNFEFRAEFFNLFNRTNFRAPNGNRSAAASARSPRPTIRGSCSSG